MKKFIISFAIVLLLSSLMGANVFAGNNESDRISNVVPEMSPGAMTPPPGEAIDVLVEAGYMTLAESKVIWNFYYSSSSSGGEYNLGAVVRALWKIAEAASVLTFVYEAGKAVANWVSENWDPGPAPYGCAVPSFGGGGLQ
jgi:hypothetical protein